MDGKVVIYWALALLLIVNVVHVARALIRGRRLSRRSYCRVCSKSEEVTYREEGRRVRLLVCRHRHEDGRPCGLIDICPKLREEEGRDL